MSEKTWKRNTAGITAHAQSRKEQKHQGVEQAIAVLLREQKPVNFNTVAKAATVSKAYLYSQPDLRERIEALRQQELTRRLRPPSASPSGKTDAGKDLVILAKDRRIKELEAENRQLKRELEVALGKLYERM
jgi:hypothetical protein